MTTDSDDKALEILRGRLIDRRNEIDDMSRRMTRTYGDRIPDRRLSRLQRQLRVERNHIIELLTELSTRS